MSVRDMQGNPGIWEELSWADMSGDEKRCWTILGWQQNKWDRNDSPASANMAWKDLTPQEQGAAANLGFTEDIWDNFEDQ